MVAQTIAGRSHRGHAPHVHPHARRRGFYLLGLAGLSLGLHLWLAQGVLFPIPRSTGVEYVFVSASGARFGALTAAACAFVFAGHLLVRLAGAAQGAQPPLFADEDVAYARPFLVFAACALALLNLVPGLGRVLPTWSYLVVDPRWWWRALVLGWVLVGIDGRLRGALRGWLARAQPPAGIRRWTPEVALAAIAIAWAVAGTPTLRFSGVTYGDEPKYLRYCELLYQGLGFEISAVRPSPSYLPIFARAFGGA